MSAGHSRSPLIAELLRREEEARVEAMLREDTQLPELDRQLAEEQWPETVEMLRRVPWGYLTGPQASAG